MEQNNKEETKERSSAKEGLSLFELAMKKPEKGSLLDEAGLR